MKVARSNSHPIKNQTNFLNRFGLENILNLIPAAVYCCDLEGNIMYYNQKAIELWGRKPNVGDEIEKFCGSYKIYNLDGSYLPHEKCPMATAILQRLPAFNGDIIVERPDNSWAYVKANISAITDENGQIVGAINTLKDVSAEWELNQAYKTTMENFRFLADFIPQLVWMANAQGELDYYNQNCLSYSGLSIEALKTGGWFQITHPDDLPYCKNRWMQSVNTGEIFNVTVRFKRGADQSYRWFLVRAIPMKREKDEIIRWFGTCTDVHDQKLTEKKLAENNEKLEQANQQLSKINNHLDTFIYTASHDLRAPISNIEGLTSYLISSINRETIDKERINHSINLIFSSVNKFKATINNLTEITKIQKNLSDHTAIEQISLTELVKEIADDIDCLIKKNQAIIKIECSDSSTLHFSRANLKSIIYNLISNAIKYRHHARTPVVVIKTVKQENELILSVSDNGLGFNENIKAKLFTLFKRFHNHVEGSGMGLYIVKKIVDNANGRIEVESEEGIGSTFNICLPC